MIWNTDSGTNPKLPGTPEHWFESGLELWRINSINKRKENPSYQELRSIGSRVTWNTGASTQLERRRKKNKINNKTKTRIRKKVSIKVEDYIQP